MPLPTFTVTGNIQDILGTSTGGELDTAALTSAILLFTPNTTDVFVWDGDLYPLKPITAGVSTDGSIVKQGQPVVLLANDAGLNFTGLQWIVTIRTSPNSVVEWTFDAPEDGGTVDLASVAHAPSAPAVPVAGLTQATLLALIEGSSDIHDAIAALGGAFNLPAAIHAAIGKTTPVDADELALIDSAASNGLKKLTIANLKALIQTLVDAGVSSVVAGAPGALNTLDELAAAFGDDANYAATITTALGLKAPLASPTFTGTVAGVTKSMVGLGSADNTADTAKPVSTAQQTALDGKQPLDADLTSLAAIPSGDGYAKRVGSAWAPVPVLPKTDLGLPVSVIQDSVSVLLGTSTSTPGTSEEVFTVGVNASGLYVEYIHWQPDESNPATSITFNASVSIGGTIYRITFGGRTSCTLDPGGRVTSDKIGVTVAVGDTIAVRTYLSSGTAYPPRVLQDVAVAGGFASGDLTAPGSASITASSGWAYGPATVIGHADTGSKSVFLLGDSILRGSGDGAFGGSGSQILPIPGYGMGGFGVRALAGHAGIVQASRNSDQASVAATAASLRRLSFVDRCTSAFIQLGHNDIYNGRTPAQLQADLITLAKAMRRQGIQKVMLNTLTPNTTSTDGWATTTNQTIASNNTNRVTFNNWVRGGSPVNSTTLVPVTVGTGGALLAGSAGHPITGYFEVADTVESARDSGKWKVARRVVSTGAMTNGSNVLNATGAAFSNTAVTAGGDLGSSVNVLGAGVSGALLNSPILFWSTATQVALFDNASTTVSGASVVIGPMTVDGIHPAPDGHILMAAAVDSTLL